MTEDVDVAVALGANLGSDEEIAARFTAAARSLETWARGPVRVSPCYRSAAVGPVGEQPAFVNAVLRFAAPAAIDERALLDHLLSLEEAHGRVRTRSGGPRTLDLDLLWVGDRRRDEAGLVLPHPRLGERRFVLQPLADLYGAEHRLPDGRRIAEALGDPDVVPDAVERVGFGHGHGHGHGS